MTKQEEVLKYLRTVPQANLSEIYDNVSFGYYCNEMKHLGEILSRMVKKGTVIRVKKGVFAHANYDKIKQIGLFNEKLLR